MDIGFILKKTLTLTTLVDPFLAAPLFLAATAHMAQAAKRRFARMLALTVGVGLLGGGLVGLHVLSFMGVSLAAMQVAGGVITFAVAMAMVVAKEQALKLSPGESSAASTTASLVPLGIPLLVGPAALSYVMATSSVHQASDLVGVVVPPLVAAAVTWAALESAARTQKLFSAGTLNVVERIGGFLLAAIAVEMIAAGARGLFPTLLGS